MPLVCDLPTLPIRLSIVSYMALNIMLSMAPNMASIMVRRTVPVMTICPVMVSPGNHLSGYGDHLIGGARWMRYSLV